MRRELGMFVQRTMAIESPLQRLPAEKLLALLAIVEEAVGFEQTTKPSAKVIDRPVEPLTIEAQAVPDYVALNPVADGQSVEPKE